MLAMTDATPSPRWRRRSDARPEEILDAALAEFNAKGFDAARMEDIAKRAGLSKAGVYLYFPSKEAVLKALIEARVAPIATLARASFLAGLSDPTATLKQVGAMLAQRLSQPEVFAVPRLVLGLAGRYPELADFYREHVAGVARAALENLIAEGIRKGQFRDVDPALATRALIGAVLFEMLWTHILRGEPESDIDGWARAQIDFVLQGLLKERTS
jgi:AcrR family transcriptional regulator